MATGDVPCSFLAAGLPQSERYTLNEIKEVLEHGELEEKREAMMQVITMLSEGEKIPQLLMVIIRFVMPARDQILKKLLMLYWEVVPKTGPDGKLLSEMILVCNAMRNDLNHPNEYIRGSALRLVCKLHEEELLQPLVPSVRQNLEMSKHVYVRKSAVLAVMHLYKHFDFLIPDAPELVLNYLMAETDPTCKRNAFIMLSQCDQERAVTYLHEVLDQVATFGDVLQFVVVQLLRKVFRKYPQDRARHVRCIYTLLNSTSTSVRYEAASTLVLMSTATPAVKAAASALINILCTHSDNNVKLVILDRLSGLKEVYKGAMQDLVMDMLRALASPSMQIRQKTLDICVELISTRNVEEVIQCLKKEIVKSQSQGFEGGAEYRQILILAIHTCAIRFPEVASSVVHVLMDFLSDANVNSAVDVVLFVREVMQLYPDLREELLQRLFSSIRTVKAGQVFSAALWIIGEHAQKPKEVDTALTTIKKLLGDPPFTPKPVVVEDGVEKPAEEGPSSSKDAAPRGPTQRVLADGTYATQSALSAEAPEAVQQLKKFPLRGLILAGDYFVACALANCLTKLSLRVRKFPMKENVKNAVVGRSLLVMASVLSYGRSKHAPALIDEDSYQRICVCIRVLTSQSSDVMEQIFLQQTYDAFVRLLEEQKEAAKSAKGNAKGQAEVQVDDALQVRQLKTKRGGALGSDDTEALEDDLDSDLSKATREKKGGEALEQPRIYQLTGYSDPIYAEVSLVVHQYDIVLDVMVYNQTADTLQNLSLELSTLGDLKLCDRPEPCTLGPRSFTSITATIKVTSTETGVIFGNIVYDVAGSHSVDSNCIVLNDIQIDIIDYISPATCTDAEFRAMWEEFLWEKPVLVKTSITDLNQFLEHIVKSTNMRCLTPVEALGEGCGFIAANLFAKSVFGESALANLGIEKQADGKITGHIRIRSRSQGTALSLGDKIAIIQRCSDGVGKA